jgi:hypothetical protein
VFGQALGGLIAARLISLGGILIGRELVGLGHYHQVPVGIRGHVQHIFPREEIDGGDHPLGGAENGEVGREDTAIDERERQ